MNNFRDKLSHIKNESELFGFFEENARYVENGVYCCSGIYASDTRELFLLLKEEWLKDIATDAKIVLVN